MDGRAGENGPDRGALLGAWLALMAALFALFVRFLIAGDAGFTYNEATYVELARHPSWSSYYPDALFVRHPPLFFLVLSAWTHLFGEAEWVTRLPSLVLAGAGLLLLWDAARRAAGPSAAALVAAVLGSGFLLHAYALQATMYPLAFLFACAAAWARVTGRTRLEGGALAALALTHLFGFLFLALWIGVRWRADHRALRFAALPGAWLVAATVGALLLNAEGDVMRLGPIGQFLRGGGTTGAALGSGVAIHAASAGLALLCLNPALLAEAARLRRRFPDWAIAAALFVLYFFAGAPFPRYALVPLPFVVLAGAIALRGSDASAAGTVPRARARGRAFALAAAILLAAVSLPAGFAYLEHGPDPRAAGDVPGTQDWRAAASFVATTNATRVAASGPTATAFYLGEWGYRVADRGEAPYRIGLDGPRGVEILRLDRPSDLADVEADAWLVPAHWVGTEERVAARGGSRCEAAQGLVLYAAYCP